MPSSGGDLLTLSVPALSYTGLAATTAGSIRLMTTALTGATWMPYALMAWTVGVPVVSVAAQLLTLGGPGVAKSMGGAPADETLCRLARKAADAVGVPPPQHVYMIDKQEPNAFAASGFGSSATTVAVTRGLRDLLTVEELGAVLAHEVGHLKHRDVSRNMHVAIAISGLSGVYEAGRILLDSSSRSSRKSSSDKDKDNSGSVALGLGLMGLGLASQGVAHGIRLAASRTAELKADMAAAEAFGADSMISALRKIDAAAGRRPADLRKSAAGKAYAFAMLSDGSSPTTKKAVSVWSRVARAFRTHPPLAERVEALEKAAASGDVARRPPGFSLWY